MLLHDFLHSETAVFLFFAAQECCASIFGCAHLACVTQLPVKRFSKTVIRPDLHRCWRRSREQTCETNGTWWQAVRHGHGADRCHHVVPASLVIRQVWPHSRKHRQIWPEADLIELLDRQLRDTCLMGASGDSTTGNPVQRRAGNRCLPVWTIMQLREKKTRGSRGEED